MTDPTRAAAVAALAEELMMVKAQAARYDLTIDQQAWYMISRILANPDHCRAIRAVTLTVEELAAALLFVDGPGNDVVAVHRRLTEPTDTGSGT